MRDSSLPRQGKFFELLREQFTSETFETLEKAEAVLERLIMSWIALKYQKGCPPISEVWANGWLTEIADKLRNAADEWEVAAVSLRDEAAARNVQFFRNIEARLHGLAQESMWFDREFTMFHADLRLLV